MSGMRFVRTVNIKFSDNLPTFTSMKYFWSLLEVVVNLWTRIGFRFENSCNEAQFFGKHCAIINLITAPTGMWKTLYNLLYIQYDVSLFFLLQTIVWGKPDTLNRRIPSITHYLSGEIHNVSSRRSTRPKLPFSQHRGEHFWYHSVVKEGKPLKQRASIYTPHTSLQCFNP